MTSVTLPCSVRLLVSSMLVLLAVLLLSLYRPGPDQKNHYNPASAADYRMYLDPQLSQNADLVSLFTASTTPSSLRDSLLFFKTHKTGSSTVTTVLWRQLCLLRSKNCFLPPKSNPGRIWDFTRNDHRQYARYTAGTAGKTMPFEVFLHHVKNHPFLSSSLLKQPTSKMSIVRRPSLRFQSAFHWYRLQDSLGQRNFAEFLDHLGSLDDEAAVYQRLLSMQTKWKYRTGLNTMSEELTGYRVTDVSFRKAFQSLLEDVLAFRVLLLVSDRFDESMLILRHLLHLDTPTSPLKSATTHQEESIDFSSIFYLPQKVQAYEDLSKNASFGKYFQLLDRLQSYDYLIYRLANVALDLSIQAYGQEKFLSDLALYRRQLKEVHGYCQEVLQLHRPFPGAVDNSTFSANSAVGLDLSKEVCVELSMDNKDLIADFWDKHRH